MPEYTPLHCVKFLAGRENGRFREVKRQSLSGEVSLKKANKRRAGSIAHTG